MPSGKGLIAQPALYKGGECRVVKDLEQAHFALSLETAGYMSDDIYTGQVYAVAMGGGMSAAVPPGRGAKPGTVSGGAFTPQSVLTRLLDIYIGAAGAADAAGAAATVPFESAAGAQAARVTSDARAQAPVTL